MKIKTTVGKLVSNYDWEEVYKILAKSDKSYLDEGLADSEDEIELTFKQAERIGLKVADCI